MGQNSSSQSVDSVNYASSNPEYPPGYGSDDDDSSVSSSRLVSPIEPPIDRKPLLAKVGGPSPGGGPLSSSYKVLQIHEWPLNDAAGRILTFGCENAKRFRLIDCSAYVNGIIRIVEYDSDDAVLPPVVYAAISYVWKGIHQAKHAESFAVAGALDGDPISQGVLRVACIAAIQHGAQYIWLDRLCVLQTSRVDKDWQIMNMAKVYEGCHVCLVLTGGLGRLSGFLERSPWMHRSWTLQEALLPKKVKVIIRWEAGNGHWDSGRRIEMAKQLPDVAIVELEDILWPGDEDGKCVFTPDTPDAGEITGFMKEDSEAMRTLRAARTIGSRDRDSRETAIWRCALMRTSKRDVDVVYSIMGLFGVSLDPSTYRGASQVDVMISLVKEIMRKGGRANWFAATLAAPVTHRLSTMPNIPENVTVELGILRGDRRRLAVRDDMEQALIRIPTGYREPWSDEIDAPFLPAWMVVTTHTWYLENAPKGSVDDAGFVHFEAPMSAVTITLKREAERDLEPRGFQSIADIAAVGMRRAVKHAPQAQLSGEVGTHAVAVGKAQPFPFESPRSARAPTILMVLKRHAANNGWYRTGTACVPTDFTEGWPSQKVRVGGVRGP